MSLKDDLIATLDPILSIRDDLGLSLRNVAIVTRTWSGAELGDGTATETKVNMRPSPKIVDMNQKKKVKEAGAVEGADVMLRSISKNSYPTKAHVDCSSSTARIEKFYEIGSELYRVVAVREKQLTWVVELKQHSDQTRYPAP